MTPSDRGVSRRFGGVARRLSTGEEARAASLTALGQAGPMRDTSGLLIRRSRLVDDGVDTGPVLAQAAVDVHPGDTVESLHERIKIEERRLLVGTVAALALKGATVTGREVSIP